MFLNNIVYRQSRFLQCEKKALREQFMRSKGGNININININNNFNINNNNNFNNNNNNNTNTNNTILPQLLIDFHTL